MCGPSCWICSYVGLRAENVFVSLRADVFVAGFGNLPVQGGAAEIFNFCLNYLHFFSHSHAISSLLCSINRRQRQTIAESRRHRKSARPHPDRLWDRTLGRPIPHSRREPLADSFLCIELVDYELWFVIYCGFQTNLVLFDINLWFVIICY